MNASTLLCAESGSRQGDHFLTFYGMLPPIRLCVRLGFPVTRLDKLTDPCLPGIRVDC